MISLHLGDEILLAVVDDVVEAMRLGERDLVGRAGGADDGRAEMFRPLAEDQPDAAGGGVKQDRVAGLHLEGPAQEIFGGHALQHHRRGLLVGDAVRHLDQPVGRDQRSSQ